MPYRLVKLDNGRIITGEELYDLLQDFEVPVKQPLNLLPYPVRPVKPTLEDSKETWVEYVTLNNAYKEAWIQVKAQNDILKQEYFDQFENFAEVLEDEFKLATLTVTGKNPNGTKKREYLIIDPCFYTFKQCADKLMGAYGQAPDNPLNFICYQNF